MEILLAASALVLISAPVALLVIVRAGIRQQERAASLTCQPPTLAAALARRLVGLHAVKPDDGIQQNGSATIPPGQKGACSS